ncbi:MAG: 16S rRNA (guanine(527)-N(7))-methyltransferase RsmG [Ruminococcaceae bacterium]|nr:16S rRNA (guanine(527)-N(7))-methyltransferase RsmG [Oscillospiraceae bacterium]
METIELLRQGMAEYGLDTASAEGLMTYLDAMLAKNEVMNLTAIRDPEEAVKLHLLDALSLLTDFDFKGKSVIDVGCGAGLPGMPLRIAEPSVNLTLLDATGKKIAFLQECCDAMGLSNVTCLHARAEETGMRECFDVAVSRAVAQLNVLSELCLPFVKIGGWFCAMKAVASQEEVDTAMSAIKKLGGRLDRQVDVKIPGTDVVHRLVWIEKIAPTPAAYPRRYAKIKASPL